MQGVGLGDDDDDDDDDDIGRGAAAAAAAPIAPIDACCGVIVHLFVSSPQDLPVGAHDSSVKPPGGAAIR